MSRNRRGTRIWEAIRSRPGARNREAMKAERSAALVAAWLDAIRYAPDGEEEPDCQVTGCTGTPDVSIWPTATAHWPDDSGPGGVVDREGAACIYHAWLILNWMPRAEVTRVEVYVERDELSQCTGSDLAKLQWIVRQWPDAIGGLLPAD